MQDRERQWLIVTACNMCIANALRTAHRVSGATLHFARGVRLGRLTSWCCGRQRKYAVAPAPPVAHMAPRVTREQHSRLRALPTAEDADRIFEAYDQSQGDTEAGREWRNKKN